MTRVDSPPIINERIPNRMQPGFKHAVILTIASPLALGTAHGIPLSGSYTGIITSENISNTIDNTGSSVSGTFSIDPTGCQLGSNQFQGGYSNISGCLTRGGIAFTLTETGVTMSYGGPAPASVPGGIVSLSSDGGTLTAEFTGSPKASETFTLDGLPGAFGNSNDYTSLQPGVVTGGSFFLRGFLSYETINLTSVTFNQPIGSPVPEPASTALVGAGLIAAVVARRPARARSTSS